MKPLSVLIAGRPNVGKSSLLNALLGYRRSIVVDEPGTTLDEVAQEAVWEGVAVELIDSQGIEGETDSPALKKMLDRADVVCFVVDKLSGITPFDSWLAQEIRKSEKPVLLCVNKTENDRDIGEFAALGFKEMTFISAAHRQNLSVLTGWVLKHAPAAQSVAPDVTVALVGRPNAGKSTLMNHLCSHNVSIVSPTAHTTRDPVSFEFERAGRRYRMIDTAGIRRRPNRKKAIEVFSIQAAKRAVRESDVALLLIKSTEELTDQDKRLISLLEEEGKPTAILLNFWDEMTPQGRTQFIKETKHISAFKDFPVQPISAKTGLYTERCLSIAQSLADKAKHRIPTARLNDVVKELVMRNPPPAGGKGNFNILYASQVKTRPPTFVFFMNRKESLPGSYQRYLNNELKKSLGFEGQPIRLLFRGSEKKMRPKA